MTKHNFETLASAMRTSTLIDLAYYSVRHDDVFSLVAHVIRIGGLSDEVGLISLAVVSSDAGLDPAELGAMARHIATNRVLKDRPAELNSTAVRYLRKEITRSIPFS